MPAPPRIAVFPSPFGSHAKPTRGAQFLNDGFLANGSPTMNERSLATSRSVVSRPFASDGMV